MSPDLRSGLQALGGNGAPGTRERERNGEIKSVTS